MCQHPCPAVLQCARQGPGRGSQREMLQEAKEGLSNSGFYQTQGEDYLHVDHEPDYFGPGDHSPSTQGTLRTQRESQEVSQLSPTSSEHIGSPKP